jgi:hypothetical protein
MVQIPAAEHANIQQFRSQLQSGELVNFRGDQAHDYFALCEQRAKHDLSLDDDVDDDDDGSDGCRAKRVLAENRNISEALGLGQKLSSKGETTRASEEDPSRNMAPHKRV